MVNVLEVENLSKNFGAFTAVDNISFNVPKGKVIGLLGPNGAGKTTTIHMLLGVLLKNGGSIKYFGKEFYSHKQQSLSRINFASAYSSLQLWLSVWENLLVYAHLYSVKNPQNKINSLLDYFEIAHLKDQKFKALSAGQRTRVILVKSLLNDPEIILMDEPTASLDPDIGDKTLSLIEDLRKSRDLSILYTSHDMDEITRICDEVVFLGNGKIVAQDTPLNLTKSIPSVDLRITFEADPKFIKGYLIAHKLRFHLESGIAVVIKTKEEMLPKIIHGLHKTGIKITDIDVNKPTLDDVFLEIARKERDEAL